jgi:cytochrome b561
MNHHKYTPRAIGLHWLLAIALVAQIGLGLYMADIPKGVPNRAWYFNLHKSIGIVAALLIFYRLWWRSRNPVPTLPITMPVWEQIACCTSAWWCCR